MDEFLVRVIERIKGGEDVQAVKCEAILPEIE